MFWKTGFKIYYNKSIKISEISLSVMIVIYIISLMTFSVFLNLDIESLLKCLIFLCFNVFL